MSTSSRVTSITGFPKEGAFFAILQAMADAVCLLDDSGKIEFVNPAAEKLLGGDEQNLLGMNVMSIISGNWPIGKERRRGVLALHECIRTDTFCRSDARFRSLRGTTSHVTYAYNPCVLDGNRRGAVLSFCDITERKLNERALRKSEARFRSIFESAAVGIMRLTPEGRLLESNQALQHMLGFSANELENRHLEELIHADDFGEINTLFREMISQQRNHFESEHRLQGKDGSVVWVNGTMSFVRDEEAEEFFVVAILENVTARKQLEVTLRHAQKLESVGRLAAGIAHEINTPIQFVSDNTHFVDSSFKTLAALFGEQRDLLKSFVQDISALTQIEQAEEEADLAFILERVPEAIAQSLDGLSRVATIVRAMKTFAHSDARSDQQSADLNQALESTITVARGELKQVAEVETHFGNIDRVVCYPGDLNQVFLNLLVNAAHAIADANTNADSLGKITIRTFSEGDDVIVSIADTGSGIPEAVQERIFDPFFTTKEVGRGTGQGLALARAVVVDKHQGTLTFETEVGKGTTFYVRLPIRGLKDKAAAVS